MFVLWYRQPGIGSKTSLKTKLFLSCDSGLLTFESRRDSATFRLYLTFEDIRET